MKDLYRLKKMEYQSGAERALNNSEKHYDAAKILAQNEMYPFAISHIILSTEELAKAVVLKMRSIDNSAAVPDFDRYFKSHSLKHDSIFKMSNAIDEFSNEKKNNEYIMITAFLFIAIVLYTLQKNNNRSQKIEEEIENDLKDVVDSIEKIRIASTYVEFLNSRVWRVPFEEYNKDSYSGIHGIYLQIVPKIKNFVFNGGLNFENMQSFIDSFSSNITK